VLSLLARARQAEELGALIGVDVLSITERRYLDFAHRFEADFIAQGPDEARTLDDTLDRAWATAAVLPVRELTMVTRQQIDDHLPPDRRSGPKREGEG
jgi:V/A-type H+-transporting ATPase subunit B